MTGYTAADKFKYWLFQDKIPTVKILVISNILTFLAIALFKQDAIARYLSFFTLTFFAQPWTALTYPLVWATRDPISLLFSAYWLWMAGGSLERSWGSLKFSIFFFQMCAVSALGLFLGTMVTGEGVAILNLWVPLAGLTVAFAMLNPEQQIMFFFVIPMKLKYLAMLSAGLLLIQFGMISPLMGVLAMLGCAYAYWYIRRPAISVVPRRQPRGEVVRVFEKRRPASRLNPFAAIKEWNEKKKLKDLFERSFGDDEHDERGRR